MNNTKTSHEWGLLILRIVVGVVFAAHGAQKLMGGVDSTAGFMGFLGIPMPQIAAIVLIAVELVGGIALILGLGTRYVAALLAVDMLVAMVLVHLANGFFVSTNGIELVLLLLAASLFFVLSGGGRLAVDQMWAKAA